MTIHSFSNVEALTAALKSSLADGDAAIVVEVGRGGTFVWRASANTSADQGTIFASNEGGNGRWFRLDPYPLNIRWFGAVGDGVADDTGAFAAAFAVGGHMHVPLGTYLITESLGAMPDSMWLQGSGPFGDGKYSELKFTGTGSLLITSSRNKISDLWVNGPASDLPNYTAAAGTGIEVQGGHHVLDRVRVTGFENGIQIGGAYWCDYRSVIVEFNLTGIALDCASGQFSTTQLFSGAAIKSNKFGGVTGVNVPVRNVCYTFVGGSIESNGSGSSAAPQFKPLALEQLSMTGVYFEDPGAENVTLDLALCGDVAISSCFFNGASYHIASSSNGSSHILFTANRFLGTSEDYAVYLPDCMDVTHRANESDTSYYLTGSGSGLLATV